MIGGSSIQEMLSLEPYGCQRRLWYRDTGKQPDYPESNPGALARGIWGESAAARVYTETTGRRLRRVNRALTRSDNSEFGAHLDRHIVAGDGRGPGVLEIKCPGENEWRWVRRNGMRPGHIMQLQWYLYITGWTWGAYAVFSLERWELIHFDIERDNDLTGMLAEAAYAYLRVRDNGPTPERLDAHDKRCARCVFRTTCQGAALVALMGEGNDTMDVDLGISPLVTAYLDAKALMEEADEVLADARKPLEAALGDRQAVETAGARVYFRAQPGAMRWDVKALEKDHPELAGAYKRPGQPMRPLRVYPI